MEDILSLNDPVDGSKSIELVGGRADGTHIRVPANFGNYYKVPVLNHNVWSSQEQAIVSTKTLLYVRNGLGDDGVVKFKYAGEYDDH
jgi:hypothetical protein